MKQYPLRRFPDTRMNLHLNINDYTSLFESDNFRK